MFKAVLLDLDGTVYKGKSAIEGAKETIETLRENGVSIFYLTNASTKSRERRVDVIRKFGIGAEKGEIYSSAYAAAKYIAENHPGKTVFEVGVGGIVDELEERGIRLVADSSAGVVVVGLDRTLSYDKLAIASKAIMDGAEFIAANEDATFPVEEGFMPGSGAVVAFVRTATGKEPFILGKPNSYMIELVMEEHGFRKEDMVIVGDRLDTDILAGKNAGIKTALVLTGVATREDVEKLEKGKRPDYVLDSIKDVLTLP
ncbi:TPA: HAD-IIA family hydrolase [Candidatus Micrarchaeota archaeon]|nr:HAD-IIA family hydrolase [Candidatus Micrarchaeota archaeon]